MQLIPWSHDCSDNFTLRGWHSEPSGRPLLHFLHGNGFCGLAYEPLLMRLGEHFDLWLSDAQGHGDSDHGGPFRGWDRSAELAVEAFQAGRSVFGEVPRYAVGHSFGGVLTSLILARHPALFERAVLLDPVLFSPAMLTVMAVSRVLGLHRRHGLARKAATRRSQWPDRDTAVSSLQERGIFRGWSEASLQAYVAHAIGDCGDKVVLKCRPNREVEVFSSRPTHLWPDLQRIEAPTLILHGEQSYPFVVRSAQRLARLNPSVTEQPVAGGHCFMQQDPVSAAQAIELFLRG
ncbi:alpha/beta hydrolase [Pseudomonas sp. S75]|uniref:alpha/beta fold hydrolase n=1 Tax=unclassified Pseudomonas TaxID=196821 RepID=UPI001908A046|nr:MULTISPECIES: alpha/beta hydrolase [unclassified Pseudomonas]MBJ9973870.1 alpha/beta hydrolase [Pseudomonas sp. S30]MBK0152200.1 alpha/beta hydrolase [Pseudomonas sp. S75]